MIAAPSIHDLRDWPTDADVASFEVNGFVVGPRLLSPEALGRARRSAELLASGSSEKGTSPARDHTVDSCLRKWKNSWWADSDFQKLATADAIGYAGAQLIRAKAIYLWEDHLIWKSPSVANRGCVGWHQDKQYWKSASGTQMLTAVIALDDCIAETGCLHFIQGSHKWGLLHGADFYEHSLVQQAYNIRRTACQHPWREIVCPIPAGHVSFHHCLTLHSSGPNLSNGPRRVLSVHLMAGSTRIVRGKGHLNETLTDRSHGRHFRGAFFPRLWPPDDPVEERDSLVQVEGQRLGVSAR